jgi:DNA polymerase elongation subunit (family B)
MVPGLGARRPPWAAEPGEDGKVPFIGMRVPPDEVPEILKNVECMGGREHDLGRDPTFQDARYHALPPWDDSMLFAPTNLPPHQDPCKNADGTQRTSGTRYLRFQITDIEFLREALAKRDSDVEDFTKGELRASFYESKRRELAKRTSDKGYEVTFDEDKDKHNHVVLHGSTAQGYKVAVPMPIVVTLYARPTKDSDLSYFDAKDKLWDEDDLTVKRYLGFDDCDDVEVDFENRFDTSGYRDTMRRWMCVSAHSTARLGDIERVLKRNGWLVAETPRYMNPLIQFMGRTKLRINGWATVERPQIVTDPSSRLFHSHLHVKAPPHRIRPVLHEDTDVPPNTPQRLLSFDMEGYNKDHVMVRPERGGDRGYMIVVSVLRTGWNSDIMLRNRHTGERIRDGMIASFVLTTQDMDPIPEAITVRCRDELEIACVLRRIVVAFRVDVITGHNIVGFDFLMTHSKVSMFGYREEQASLLWFQALHDRVEVPGSRSVGDTVLTPHVVRRNMSILLDELRRCAPALFRRVITPDLSKNKHVMENTTRALVEWARVVSKARGRMERAKDLLPEERAQILDKLVYCESLINEARGAVRDPTFPQRPVDAEFLGMTPGMARFVDTVDVFRGNIRKCFYRMSGIQTLDTLKFYQGNPAFKLDSYSLRSITQAYLKVPDKIDLSYEEQFQIYEDSFPAVSLVAQMRLSERTRRGARRMAETASYCFWDATLSALHVIKQGAIAGFMAECFTTVCPPDDVLLYGLMRRTFSQVAYVAKQEGYVITPCEDGFYLPPGEKFEGAIVLPPDKKFWEAFVCILDFKSLYPSLIIMWNLCWTTIVTDPKVLAKLKAVTDRKVLHTHIIEGQEVNFVTREVRAGLFPRTQSSLLNARSLIKKDMNLFEKGSTEYNTRNAAQQAKKISANSGYGTTGAEKSKWRCFGIAATITYQGRLSILATRDFIYHHYSWACICRDLDLQKTILARAREMAVSCSKGEDDPKRAQWVGQIEETERVWAVAHERIHDEPYWVVRGDEALLGDDDRAETESGRVEERLITAVRMEEAESKRGEGSMRDAWMKRIEATYGDAASRSIGVRQARGRPSNNGGGGGGSATRVSRESIRAFAQAESDLGGSLMRVREENSVWTRRANVLLQELFPEENLEKLRIIYGDTDSVMVALFVKYDVVAFALSHIMAETITEKLFRKPMELEMEKIAMKKFLLIGLKCYAFSKSTSLGSTPKVDSTGISGAVKRDTPFCIRDMSRQFLQMLMTRGLSASKDLIRFVGGTLQKIIKDEFELKDYAFTKRLRDVSLLEDDDAAHVQAFLRLKRAIEEKRAGTINEPAPGARIPIVLCLVPGKQSPKPTESAEHLELATLHGRKPNRVYIVESIEKKLKRILDLVPSLHPIFVMIKDAHKILTRIQSGQDHGSFFDTWGEREEREAVDDTGFDVESYVNMTQRSVQIQNLAHNNAGITRRIRDMKRGPVTEAERRKAERMKRSKRTADQVSSEVRDMSDLDVMRAVQAGELGGIDPMTLKQRARRDQQQKAKRARVENQSDSCFDSWG